MDRTITDRIPTASQQLPSEKNHNISKDAEFLITSTRTKLRQYRSCPNYISRPVLEQDIYSSYFTAAQNHGVLSNRVLLWSPPGSGKRQLAINFAHRFAKENDRKVLWVEGRKVDTFVRDYAKVYAQLTGNEPRYSTLLRPMMQKIRRTLESRFREWLLVIFDLNPILEEVENETAIALATFLPERGQLLITTSGSGLRLASGCTTIIKVGNLTDDEILGMARDHTETTGFSQRLFCRRTPLFINTFLATAKILDIPLPAFARSLRNKVAQAGCTEDNYDTSLLVPFELHVVFNIIWQTIHEHDIWAVRLLCALCVVDRLAIPRALVGRLSMFQSSISDDFSPALDLLERIGLAHVSSTDHDSVIAMHIGASIFFQFKLKSDSPDLMTLVLHEWVEVLDDHLPEYSGTDTSEYWTLLPHLYVLFKWPLVHTQPSPSYFSLVVKTAFFLVQAGNLPAPARSMTTQAITAWYGQSTPSLFPKDPELDMAKLKYVRARALTQLGMYQTALLDVNDGMKRLADVEASHESVRSLEADLLDTEVFILGVQRRHTEAQKLLERIIPQTLPNEHRRKAFRHYWLARSICDQPNAGKNAVLEALKHSHVTAEYWRTLSDEQKWHCHHGSSPIRWIARHADYLLSLQKFKGALVFLPEVLDLYIEQYGTHGTFVYEELWECMKCYVGLDDIRNAEDAMCRVLELGAIEDLTDECLTWLLESSTLMALLLYRNGRIVEAEGVCRWNIRTAETRQIIYPGHTTAGPSYDDWILLVWCLIVQGKEQDARAIRDIYQNESYTEANVEEGLWGRRKMYNRARKLYGDYLESHRSGEDVHWRLDHGGDDDYWASKLGKKLWGYASRREREGRDFESDVDCTGIRKARNSRILRLLKSNLIYLSFMQYCVEGDQVIWYDDLWTPLGQTQCVLGEFWKWCECRRKRNRSGSIDAVDLIDRRAVVRNQDHEELEEAVSMTQKLITNYSTTLPFATTKDVPGCSTDCPCISANQKGQIAYLALLEKLKPYQAEFKRKRRYPYRRKPSERRLTGPDPGMVFCRHRKGVLTRDTPYFEAGDHEDEVYIVPNALKIPSIRIESVDSPRVIVKELKQSSIRQYFLRDSGCSELLRQTAVESGPHILDGIPEETVEAEEVENEKFETVVNIEKASLKVPRG